ncbi:hypothetical protein [Palleronia sp.]|uniref:hypothetical protein n=1 Tax=Palleronia sp. TaxID=1940284 RepID=UPI0035C7DBDD
MPDITELQQRLAAALDRIEADVEQLARPAPAPEPVPEPEPPTGPDPARLEADLAAERELVQQLEERLKSTRERQEARVAAVEAELETAHGLLAEMEEDRGRLKVVADGLRESCEALRQVNAAHVGDVELVNTAMASEIEALAALRRSDRAELDAVLALFADAAENEEESDA